MNDDMKIAAAARESRDTHALNGDAKIRMAAADSGHSAHDDGAGDRKIHAAAAASGNQPYDTGAAADRKIKIAAGQAANDDVDDVMAKALSDLAALVTTLPRPRSAPLARRPPARQQPASRAAPLSQTTAPRAAASAAPAPPLRFFRGLSIDNPESYWDFRDRVAADIRSRRLESPTAERIVQHAAANYGIGLADAAEWGERFLGHLWMDRERRTA